MLCIYNKRSRQNLTLIHINATQHLPYEIKYKLPVSPETDGGAKTVIIKQIFQI